MKICPVKAALMHANRWTDMKQTGVFATMATRKKKTLCGGRCNFTREDFGGV
jgi:hypothetical protein